MSSFPHNIASGSSLPPGFSPVNNFCASNQYSYPGKIESTINQSYSSLRNPNRPANGLANNSFLDTYDLFCNYPSQAPFPVSSQFVSIDLSYENSNSTHKRRMGNGMDKVLPGLYVGSIRDSKDLEQLRANNITHILSIHDNPKKGLQEDVEYLCILALDQPHQNLSQYFAQCNDFIHSARIQGGNVLIHCLAGVSRSVTILMAYLMSVTTINWKEALKCVRVVRTIANPNLGFQRQLQEFEGRRLREERKRLRLKFPNRVFLPEDEEEVRRLIVMYQSVQTQQQHFQDRRCLSATNISSASSCSPFSHESSSRGHQGRFNQQQLGASHVHFGPLAPGRSPVMKRRTLPSPIPTSRGAKTV